MADEEKQKDEASENDETSSEETGGEENEEGSEGKKKGGSKLILFIIAGGVVLGAVGAGLFFFVFSKPAAVPEESVELAAIEAEPVSVVFYDIPPITVNLGSDIRVNRILRVKTALELTSEEDIPLVEAVLPRIQDDFQMYLNGLRAEDVQGSAGIMRLKEALIIRANQAVENVEIRNVLFREFLIQ